MLLPIWHDAVFSRQLCTPGASTTVHDAFTDLCLRFLRPGIISFLPAGCSTCCSGPGPTTGNKRQYLRWWWHCLPAHHKFPIPASDPLQPVSFQFIQLLLMGKCMCISSVHVRLCGSHLRHPDPHIQHLSLRFVRFKV
ncbi:hypothetical protein T4A_11409 [Trichinella pseudospiralis]|uniref:Uncharacterized protein n=1 Tax=Trichinella pseudospiralis TaxID=6337 RepID=A0A0V1DXN4_TRIPS|nr:hypothetical protein T4A_11409 [Trichinella pseudospiralis]